MRSPTRSITGCRNLSRGCYNSDMSRSLWLALLLSAPAAAQHHAHRALYGSYPMTREASGTAWGPEASPHEGRMFSLGAWTGMVHGFVNGIYDRQGGPRGDRKAVSQSMLMLMAS